MNPSSVKGRCAATNLDFQVGWIRRWPASSTFHKVSPILDNTNFSIHQLMKVKTARLIISNINIPTYIGPKYHIVDSELYIPFISQTIESHHKLGISSVKEWTDYGVPSLTRENHMHPMPSISIDISLHSQCLNQNYTCYNMYVCIYV